MMSSDSTSPTTLQSSPLDPEFVAAAVSSLYDDELKPFGRILRKRVAERAAAAGGVEQQQQLPNVDMKQLRLTCEESDILVVESEDGGDWSVVLAGRDPAFVDVYDPHDCYPAELWDAISIYFQALAGTPQQHLPGGRYSCAQAMVTRNLSFLQEYSLGRICHIVQLAISQKKVLGYLNGSVVPYSSSQSMMKERRAEQQLPYSKPTSNVESQELPFATFEMACTCLKAILEETRNSCIVPLSNIKRLFRSRFHLDLSETMLGHSKLSELLQDDRFAHVCEVKLASHGYVVVAKNTPSKLEPGPLRPGMCLKQPPGLEEPSPRSITVRTHRLHSSLRTRIPGRSGAVFSADPQEQAPWSHERLLETDFYSDHGTPQTYLLEPAISGAGGDGVPILPGASGRSWQQQVLPQLLSSGNHNQQLYEGLGAFPYGALPPHPPVPVVAATSAAAYHAAAYFNYAEGYAAACADQKAAAAASSPRQKNQQQLPVLLGSLRSKRSQTNIDKTVRGCFVRTPDLSNKSPAYIDEPAYIRPRIQLPR
jgi:hypothetical protein